MMSAEALAKYAAWRADQRRRRAALGVICAAANALEITLEQARAVFYRTNGYTDDPFFDKSQTEQKEIRS